MSALTVITVLAAAGLLITLSICYYCCCVERVLEYTSIEMSELTDEEKAFQRCLDKEGMSSSYHDRASGDENTDMAEMDEDELRQLELLEAYHQQLASGDGFVKDNDEEEEEEEEDEEQKQEVEVF